MNALKKGKPFIKWVGGKSQLIEQLDAQLPANFSVGGHA
jgi:DNA adenine methylase